jgi:hypothetical protein
MMCGHIAVKSQLPVVSTGTLLQPLASNIDMKLRHKLQNQERSQSWKMKVKDVGIHKSGA